MTVELEPVPAGTTNISTLLPTFDSHGNLVGTPTVDVGANAGAAGTDMLLVVMYPWPVYGGPLGLNFSNMGNGKMLMTSTQVFRIEPKDVEVLRMSRTIRIARQLRRRRARSSPTPRPCGHRAGADPANRAHADEPRRLWRPGL